MSRALSFWQERARSLMQALPDFLTLQSGRAFERAAGELYETWFDKRFAAWVPASDDRRLVERLAALPPAHWRRVRHAPRIALLLRASRVPGAADLQAMDDVLRAEEYLAGLRPEPPGTRTALGDYLADASVPPLATRAGLSGDALGALGTPSAEPTAAPSVRGIFVDAHSLDLLGHPLLGEPQPYHAEEVPALLRNLERGFARVESVSPEALRMIRANIAVLVAIRGTERRDQLSSGSNRSHIGLMSIANPDSLAWTPEDLAESFVHEAIHSVLYRIELAEFLHDTDAAALNERVCSPWSGRTLPLNTFIHACFVWFGLWNFWRLSLAAGQDCATLRLRAEKGFIGATLGSVMPADVQARLRPQAREALEEMFARVNAAA